MAEESQRTSKQSVTHKWTYVFKVDECVANAVRVRFWNLQSSVTSKENLLAIICEI